MPFDDLRRQQFRRYFQPSRIVIAVVPCERWPSKVNLVTLCFLMHCSYKPPMMAFAVHNINYSYTLFRDASEFVLAVPGEALAEQVIVCGTRSGAEVDKVAACDLRLTDSQRIGVPGLADCISNIELRARAWIPSGDHAVVFAEAVRYAVDREVTQRPLLSVGPDDSGYRVLARKGIHRIAVVAT